MTRKEKEVSLYLDGYRLGVDQDQITLYRVMTVKDESSKNYGESYEVAHTFHHTIGQAIKKIAHLEAVDGINYTDIGLLVERYLNRCEELWDKIRKQEESLRCVLSRQPHTPLANQSILQ